MKKLAALILGCIFVMTCLCGCGCTGETGNNGNGNNGNGNNVTATTPTTQSGTNQNNGTVTDGDGFIGNEGNENRNTDAPDMTMPTVTEYNTQARDMFDNVL